MIAINMEMPRCCGKCKFGQRFNPDEDICRIDGHIIKSTFETITQNRDEKCPLIGIEECKVEKLETIEQIVDDCDLEAWEVLEKIKEVLKQE